MVKMNLIGDYEGKYRISVIEWILVVLNLVMLAGLLLYKAIMK